MEMEGTFFFFFAVSCLGRSTAMNQASDKSWEVF